MQSWKFNGRFSHQQLDACTQYYSHLTNTDTTIMYSLVIIFIKEHFDSLLPLVKDYVVNIWEARKIKLYGDDSSQSQSSTGDLGEFTGIEGQSDKDMCQGGKPGTGKFHSSYIGMDVCGSAYENGCVVDGTCATAAYY